MLIKIYEYNDSLGTCFKTAELMDEACYYELEVEIPEKLNPYKSSTGYCISLDGPIDLNEILVSKKGHPALAWTDLNGDHFIALHVNSRKEKSSTRTL